MMAKPDPYRKAAATRAANLERVVFTIDVDAIARFDEWAASAGYASRAAALRDLVDSAVGTK